MVAWGMVVRGGVVWGMAMVVWGVLWYEVVWGGEVCSLVVWQVFGWPDGMVIWWNGGMVVW